jgi:cysteine desulfurase
MKQIYLDYNATTPIDPNVAKAMQPYIDTFFGNPSSSHYYGKSCADAVLMARSQLANLLKVHPDEIVFTSGGTESNNYAIKGYAFANQSKGNHIITSQIEHPAVLEVCKYLETKGFEITYLPVDKMGQISLSQLKKEIKSSTILISIMHANNEVGTIQPIPEISKIAKEHNIILHTDAAQSVGKIPVDVPLLGADLISIAGHKIYAPKGVGALFIRRGIQLEKLIHGANHEQNRRAGTENVIGIVGLGKACEIIAKEQNASEHYKSLIDKMIQLLGRSDLDFVINGNPESCLPNTLNISFSGTSASEIISRLDSIAISAGAACHTNKIEISSVLKAMNISPNYGLGTLRISVGRFTTEEEIIFATEKIIGVVRSIVN